MQAVFVLSGYWQYEGQSVLGVYESFEAAEAAARSFYEAACADEDEPDFDGFVVDEVGLGARAVFEYGRERAVAVQEAA
jgi:hypothetical protein